MALSINCRGFANGATVQFDVHSAIVNWDGGPLSVLVQAVDPMPLLGTAFSATMTCESTNGIRRTSGD